LHLKYATQFYDFKKEHIVYKMSLFFNFALLNDDRKTAYFIKEPPFPTKMNFALGIEAEILFVRYEQKDCSVKPGPQGNVQKIFKPNCTSPFIIKPS